MRCERCRAEATSWGLGGQRLCDKHYNPTMAAAPGMVGTGTAADAVGAFIVAKGVGSQVHGPRPGLAAPEPLAAGSETVHTLKHIGLPSLWKSTNGGSSGRLRR